MITVTASAPGKFVVLGEHAVVYGKPAIALAMDMRFSMQAHFSKEFRVNNAPANSFNVSPHMRYISELHGDYGQIAWGSQIRSYVFQPYTMAKDHRTGQETSNVNAVMDGAIDDFIYASLNALQKGEL